MQLALAAELAASATSKTAAAGKTARIRPPNSENEKLWSESPTQTPVLPLARRLMTLPIQRNLASSATAVAIFCAF
jgi:hypothetical protein